LLILWGVIPCSWLYASCLALRRLVSSKVFFMASVISSAYKTTLPSTFLAALPDIWIKERAERRNPVLSASKIATRETSGKSRPSRNKLTPTITSNSPNLRLLIIWARSMESISLCKYLLFIPAFCRYWLRSSLILLVSVITRTFWFFATLSLIWLMRSSTWFLIGLISISGSSKPVGLITCSTTSPLVRLSS